MDEDLIIVLKVNDQGTEVIKQFVREAKVGLTKTEETTKKTSVSMAEKLNTVGMTLTGIGKRLTIATAIIAGTLIATTRGLIAFGAQLWTTSQRTGISTEMLSEFKLSAEKSGASVMSIAKGLRTLNRELYSASTGGKDAKETFATLGVTIFDANGKLKSSTVLLYELADKFSNMENESMRTSLAMKLFGRAGVELLPMLNLGSKGLEQNAAIAKKLGIIYSKETAKAADQLQARMTELRAASQGVYMTFLTTVIPILTNYTTKLTVGISSVRAWMESHKGIAKILTTVITNFLLFMTIVSPTILIFGKLAKAGSEIVTMFASMGKVIANLKTWWFVLGRQIEGTQAMWIGHISVTQKLTAALIGLKTALLGLSVFAVLLGVFSLVQKAIRDTKEGIEEFNNVVRKVPLRDFMKELKTAAGGLSTAWKEIAVYSNNNYKAMMDALEQGKKFRGESMMFPELKAKAAEIRSYYNEVYKGKEKEAAAEKSLAVLREKYAAMEKAHFREKAVAHYEEMAALVRSGKAVGIYGQAFVLAFNAMQKVLFDVNDEIGKIMEKSGLNLKWGDLTKQAADFGVAVEKAKDNMWDMPSIAKAVGDDILSLNAQLESLAKTTGNKLPPAWVRLVASIRENIVANKEEIETITTLTKKYNDLSGALAKNRANMTVDQINQQEAALLGMAIALGKATEAQIGWYEAQKLGVTSVAGQEAAVGNLSLAYDELIRRYKSTDEAVRISNAEFKKGMSGIQKGAEEAGNTMLAFAANLWVEPVRVTRHAASEMVGIVIKAARDISGIKFTPTMAWDKTAMGVMVAGIKKLVDAYTLLGITARRVTERELKESLNAVITLAMAGEKNLAPALEKLGSLFAQLGKKVPRKQIIEQIQLFYDTRRALLAAFGVKIPEIDFKKLFKNLPETAEDANASLLSISGAFQTLASVSQMWSDSFREDADDYRAQMEGVTDVTERASLEHKAIMADNMAMLTAGVSTFASTFKAVKDAGKSNMEALAAAATAAAGQIGGALGQMISGAKKSFASLGAALGGAIGSIFGPIGSAIGSFLGGLIGGLFKKKKTAAEIAAENQLKWIAQAKSSMNAYGKITDETAKKIAELRKTMSKGAAEAMSFADVINDVGVNQTNVNKLWTGAAKILDEYAKKTLTAKQAAESLGASFSALVEGARNLGTEGSKAMIDFIAKTKASGLAVKEVTDYINAQLGVTKREAGSAAEGLFKMSGAIATGLEDLLTQSTELQVQLNDRLLRGWKRTQVEKQYAAVMDLIKKKAAEAGPALDRLGHLTLKVFNAMIENGASLGEAMSAIGPTLDNLIFLHEKLGISAGANIQQLMNIRKVQQEYQDVFDAIEGNLDVLSALGNTGSLTQESFDLSAQSMLAYFDKLKTAGLTEKQALAAVAPTLNRLVFLSKEQNMAIDAGTQALIDKANAQGILAKQEISTNNVLMAGFGYIIKALKGDIPDAFKEAMTLMEEESEMARRRAEKVAEDRAKEAGALSIGVVGSAADMEVGLNGVTAGVDRLVLEAKMGLGTVDESFRGVTNTIYDAVDALDDLSVKLEKMRGTTLTITARAEEPTIHAQEGGTWRVNSPDQLFRAHQGETVKISPKGESSEAAEELRKIVQALAALEGRSGSTTVNFDINTVDADSMEKVIRTKIVPVLSRLSKGEQFLVHPKGVREF